MLPPGTLPPQPDLRPLQRISPSRFTSLKDCRLREVWAAGGASALLPVHPRARLGTVAHRLLEVAAKGGLSGTDPAQAVSQEWDAQIAAVEATMRESWLERSFVPLRRSVADYEVRRLRACNHAVELALPTTAVSADFLGSGGASFEVWVQSSDGRVGGYIDHVIETACGVVLRDYKSGYVLEKTGVEGIPEVKESYQVQLRLYAALYHATFGCWPAGLEIVPLQGDPIPVPFDPDGCTTLLLEAVNALEALNREVALSSLASGLRNLATPSPAACSFCPYRPVCHVYWDTRPPVAGQAWPNDCRGTAISIQTLGNGKRMLTIDGHQGSVIVRALDASPDRHPALTDAKVGDTLVGYNLRPTPSPRVWEQSPMTVVYRDDG